MSLIFNCFVLSLLWFSGALVPVVEARTFTDDGGRQTEAELAGVVGDEVVLRKGGVSIRWPLNRLSAEDQGYVKKWQANPPVTPKVLVRMWEKKGFSSAGTFGDGTRKLPGLPNIPGVLEIEKKATYFYFDVDVSNPGDVQANHLSVAYQLYVINAAGETVVEAGAVALSTIDPDGRGTISTEAISTTRTKTTSRRWTRRCAEASDATLSKAKTAGAGISSEALAGSTDGMPSGRNRGSLALI